MTNRVEPELMVRMATEIVVAFLDHNRIDVSDLPSLVKQIRAALEDNPGEPDGSESRFSAMSSGAPRIAEGAASGTGTVETSEPQPGLQPALPVENSVTEEFIYSLEDGRPYRSLKRHLMAQYGMTPEDYRRKWSLPADYPMVAPSYARDRSEVARRIGLGKHKPATSAKTRKRPAR